MGIKAIADKCILQNYIQTTFLNNPLYKTEYLKKLDSIEILITFFDSDSYIKFVINDEQEIRRFKLELGSLNPSILCKLLFTLNKKHSIEFVQHSSFGFNEEKYLHPCNNENLSKVSALFKALLGRGWVENQFYYKRSIYKVVIDLKIDDKPFKQKVLIQSMEEQDIPLPFEKITREIGVKIIDLLKKGVSFKSFYIKL